MLSFLRRKPAIPAPDNLPLSDEELLELADVLTHHGQGPIRDLCAMDGYFTYTNMRLLASLVIAAGSLIAAPNSIATEAVAESELSVPHKDVLVRDRVILPDEGMYFSGQQQKTLGLFGLVGGLAASQASMGPKETLQAVMSDKNIKIDEILHDRFLQELNNFELIPDSEAISKGAQVQLEIVRFGLSAIPWHVELRPVVVVTAKLVGTDGSVLWSMKRKMDNHSDPDIPAHLYEDYLKDPELLRSGFSLACQISSKELITNLAKSINGK